MNSVTYNGDTGTLVASAGDDLMARVWESASQKEIAKFLLTSPGMSACSSVLFRSQIIYLWEMQCD